MAEHFGKRLRRLRGNRSQREVAAELEIPTTTLSSLEQQDTIPRGAMLQRLCDYFDVSVDYFFPSEQKATSNARQWLQDLRRMQFDVSPTIATHSAVAFDDKIKSDFAKHLRAKIGHTSKD